MDEKKEYPELDLSLEEFDAIEATWEELTRQKDLEDAEKLRGTKVKSLRQKYRRQEP